MQESFFSIYCIVLDFKLRFSGLATKVPKALSHTYTPVLLIFFFFFFCHNRTLPILPLNHILGVLYFLKQGLAKLSRLASDMCDPSHLRLAGDTDSPTPLSQHTFSRMWKFQLASSGPRKPVFSEPRDCELGEKKILGF